VPPNPVTLQNNSYKGTAAKDNPSIKKNIDTRAIGVSFFLSILIIFLYYKYLYCKKLKQIKIS
jgi:hypothetical protein